MNSPRIVSCDMSFVWLVDRSSGERIEPSRVKTYTYNDDDFIKQTTNCMYLFNLEQDAYKSYDLHISEDLFGCMINSITYTFDQATEYYPLLLQY